MTVAIWIAAGLVLVLAGAAAFVAVPLMLMGREACQQEEEEAETILVSLISKPRPSRSPFRLLLRRDPHLRIEHRRERQSGARRRRARRKSKENQDRAETV